VALVVLLIFRRGFLCAVAALTVAGILADYPVVFDPSAWYFPTSMALLIGLTAIGVAAALGARGRLMTRS
jgi:hypothetical protein